VTDLRELTLEQLASSLRTEAEASAPKDQEAWNALVSLADGLDRGDGDNYLIKDRRWLLQSLKVEGFRGAKREVTLQIPSTSGVTVLYGQNGSGKSSLAEALRVALEGRTGATHLGESGTLHELWGSSDERSRGAESADIDVSLLDEHTDDTLRIIATITPEGVARRGTLTSGGEVQDVPADSAAWHVWLDALRASPPVLAYAELADELQRKRDLQVWLTSCLAMDNATRVFDNYVKAHVDDAASADKKIGTARTTSTILIEEVDEEARMKGLEDVAPLIWGDSQTTQQLEEWLIENELTERHLLDNQFDSSSKSAAIEHAREYLAAIKSWSEASSQAMLTPHVTDSLIQMHRHVVSSHQGDNGGLCPTCGTQQPQWRQHLGLEVERLQGAKEAATILRNLMRRQQSSLSGPLKTAITVVSEHQHPDAVIEVSRLLRDVEAAASDAPDLDVQLLAAVERLALWTTETQAHLFMDAAIAASGLEHQWRSKRWSALSGYIAAFDENITIASQFALLKKARSKWNSHLARMRKDRSSTLQSLVGPAVASLLEDVGISVKAIDITKSESRLELENAQGESVELAHLSAGQRNALILGPVIATAESGIFGFAVLDDPVHAFDDFRVDKLSSTLSKVGGKQSLIITTHDARFVEYLRVHGSSAFTVLSTDRDADGQVTLTPTLDPPSELIKFAKELTRDMKAHQATNGHGEINALLRMAIDEGFEQIALRHFARVTAPESEQARSTFEAAMTTQDRKTALRRFMSDSPQQLTAFTTAWQLISTPVVRWSTAVHSSATEVDYDQLESDIDLAASSIAHMRDVHWP
jgi:energy-coupling factor transporter ATP-binding protein EcfA2